MHRLLAYACLGLMLAGEGSMANEKRRPLKIDDLYRFARVSRPAGQPRRQAASPTSSPPWTSRATRAARPSGSPRRPAATPRALTTSGKRDTPPALEPRRQVDPVRLQPLRVEPALADLPLAGGEAKQLTTISTGAGDADLVARRQADRLRPRRSTPNTRTSRSRRADAAEQEAARRRSRRSPSRRGSSRGSSTATGTATSRTSGSTCSS